LKILGISAFYHDSAAALIGDDGIIIAAAQEERFSRIKHDSSFPSQSIEYCLNAGDISIGELDHVVFYEKPFLKFDRLLETYLSFAPYGLRSFMAAMPQWLKEKLHLPREIRRELGKSYQKSIAFLTHHESHAASAFFPSPFEDAAILTMDGVGEWETATIGIGTGNKIKLLKSLKFPHSLGLLYSAFTYFCGFRVNSGEYKLMGLAPYGKPVFKQLILDELLDLKEDGSFSMNIEFFNYCQGLTMTNHKFANLFGGPPRKPEMEITEREMNLAASIQVVTEEIVLRMATFARDTSGQKNLCLAGGVALNCVANGKLLEKGIFEKIWIQPASGDAGGALGAALFIHHQLLEKKRIPIQSDSMSGSYLGPSCKNESIKEFLERIEVPYAFFDCEDDLLHEVASEISNDKIVGWFQGRMEFGPRALGNRSIIGDARSEKMQSKMNLSIKYRESFRPFAPSVLAEDADSYFQLKMDSPYMLIVAPINDELACELSEYEDGIMASDPNLLKRVNVKRSSLPAITHVDMSARIQTVCESRNKRYYRLIRKFKKLTGSGVIVNTSFNIRGEPIVCSPEDAYRCFISTEMDVLVIEDFVLYKSEQPKKNYNSKAKYLASFSLD